MQNFNYHPDFELIFIHSLFGEIQQASIWKSSNDDVDENLNICSSYDRYILMSMSNFFPPNKHIQSFGMFPFFVRAHFGLFCSVVDNVLSRANAFGWEFSSIFSLGCGKVSPEKRKTFFKNWRKIDLLVASISAVSDIFVNKLRTLLLGFKWRWDAMTHKFPHREIR